MSIKIGDRCPSPDCNGTVAAKGKGDAMTAKPGFTDAGTRTRYQTWRCSTGHDFQEELKG
jgi:hypothetical protein